MIRALHRWPGLLAAALLLVLAVSGAALSVFPATETLSTPSQAAADLSVAELAGRVRAAYPGVEQIRRAPSGRITAYWFEDGAPGAAVIDPTTGEGVGSADRPQLERWLTNLHRSLFLGDGGRIAAAIGAGAMLILSVSGAVLVARRMGGWRRVFGPLRGPLAGRLHIAIARVTVAGLALSSVTALWMTASTFELVPEGAGPPPFPVEVSGQTGADPAGFAVLQYTPAARLRELTFPYPGDETDVFTLKTDLGAGYLDQGTGALLAWSDVNAWDRINGTVAMLHTGRGAALLGLLLGLAALGVPAMAVTGGAVWLNGRRGRPRIRGNAAPGAAETVILVGSEGGSTWGFAATLHTALREAGQTVHTGAMSSFAPDRYARARQVIVLAATYGEGDAPASAKGFLDRLAALPKTPRARLAVLGFGDRSFPAFCAYADAVAQAAAEKGWAELLPIDRIDRQSPQDFARWGRALSVALGLPLELNHRPVLPRSQGLTLISRRDYGAEVQAPTAILRFALPRRPLWARLTTRGPRFEAGDLIGILPKGSDLPRFYSLASSSRDGFAEICVRKHPGGLCSGQLMELRPGGTVRAFIRRNPGFRPARGRRPVILIGAGTGIGPLAGFARANRARRPMHLYFGARHPQSDLLYDRELEAWQQDGRLAALTTAFSRSAERAHVQDALRRDAAQLARLIASGAQVMVCGGREMAAGVSAALTEILAPTGLTPAMLKAEGRYAEDVY